MEKEQTNREREHFDKKALHQTLADQPTERKNTAFSRAKRLLEAGQTKEAESILQEEIAAVEENEEMLQELYFVYKKRHEWRKAKTIADRLVELNPQQANYYFQLGRAYAFLKDDTSAKEAYVAGLQKRHEVSFPDLIAEVTQGFTSPADEIFTDYLYIKGKNNFGALFHTAGEKQYLTKIAKYNQHAKREELFYKAVCTQFPQLQNIVPAFIHSKVLNRILYLTTEWIDGVERDAHPSSEMLELSRTISSVPYSSVMHAYGKPTYTFQYRNRPAFIIQFFTEIHVKETNEKLFKELYKLLEEKRYPKAVQEVIQRLEKQIIPHGLYAYIDPEYHYSLMHGDFHSGNCIRNSKNGALYIVDWASFTTGPHFLDIARYLSKALFTFREVREIYFDDEQTGGRLTDIERIFFLYALVLLYILRLKEKAEKEYVNTCIIPALEELEQLVQQFTEENHEDWLLDFREQKNQRGQEIKRLEDRLAHLQGQHKQLNKHVKKLEKQNKQMKESTSWKVTAPFRKLMEKWRE